MAGEGLRHPRILVSPVPDGDTNAALECHACGNDRGVVLLLLLEQSRCRGEGHADVELGEGDLNAECDKCSPVGLVISGRVDFANDQMSLNTDTVDGHVLCLQGRDEVLQRGRLGTSALDVVVVDVELGGRIGRASRVERDGDIRGPESVVEDVRTPSTIIVEGL